jgi:hypothetical protein
MLPLAVPKQNSRRRRVVELDVKASKRGGGETFFVFGDFVVRTIAAALDNLRGAKPRTTAEALLISYRLCWWLTNDRTCDQTVMSDLVAL